ANRPYPFHQLPRDHPLRPLGPRGPSGLRLGPPVPTRSQITTCSPRMVSTNPLWPLCHTLSIVTLGPYLSVLIQGVSPLARHPLNPCSPGWGRREPPGRLSRKTRRKVSILVLQVARFGLQSPPSDTRAPASFNPCSPGWAVRAIQLASLRHLSYPVSIL